MISLGIGGGVWAATESPLALPVAIATGVLIDTDHALDFFNWYVKRDQRYFLVLFHAWEYSAIGLGLMSALWYHPLFLAALMGHLGHLIADQLMNSLHPMAYSIGYRSFYRFDRKRFMGERLFPLSKVLHANLPFWLQIEPWLFRISRIRNKQD